MEKAAIQPRAVSVFDAAKALGLGATSTWRLISSGQLRAVKLGGRTLVTVAEIDRVLNEATSSGGAGHERR